MKPEDHWQKIAPNFREAIPNDSTTAPHGFATRVVALGALSEKKPLPTRFRNWSLLTAATTSLTLVILVLTHQPPSQFIPLPELDLPTPLQP